MTSYSNLKLSQVLPLLLAVLGASPDVSAVNMGNRFVFQINRPLLTARLDPNVNPGAISQHVHRVVGGSAFNPNYDPVAYRKANCSTVPAQADKGNYWHPSVYKVNYDSNTKKQTYSPMWAQTRVYYNFPQLNSGSGPGTYVEPFPDNFQMIAGNPAKKTGGGYSQEDLSVFYYCEQKKADGTTTGYSSYSLPKEGCSVLMSKVWFPSCWNGQTGFDSRYTSDYVKYPDIGGGLQGPTCPKGYEHRIPIILIETFHIGAGDFADGPAGKWGSNGDAAPTYILANGDTTGYGLHADFANGWDSDVLARVVKECTQTDFDLSAGQACPPLAASWNEAAAASCHSDAGVNIPAEQVGWEAPLDALPGCNLPWTSGPKPTCSGYQERKLASWSTLVGVEQNEEVSADVLQTPYAPLAASSSPAPNGRTSGLPLPQAPAFAAGGSGDQAQSSSSPSPASRSQNAPVGFQQRPSVSTTAPSLQDQAALSRLSAISTSITRPAGQAPAFIIVSPNTSRASSPPLQFQSHADKPASTPPARVDFVQQPASRPSTGRPAQFTQANPVPSAVPNSSRNPPNFGVGSGQSQVLPIFRAAGRLQGML